jgi:hypothetical protein
MISEALPVRKKSRLWELIRDNGLSLTLVTLFLIFLIGQALAGHRHYNQEQTEHGGAPVTLSQYLKTGEFIEATAENWESEFLQMAAYVLFTAFLFQRGSAESKKIGEEESVDRDPRLAKHKQDTPWPVQRGGWALSLYSYSLSLALIILFVGSFGLHAIGGMHAYNEEQVQHGGSIVSLPEYMTSAQFWFESLQNWQSEFLAIAVMVVFSIFLRHRGSPESKPVDAPHNQTGAE